MQAIDTSSINVNRLKNEAGISAFEYVIALIIIMIAFVGWLQLTSTAVKNGTHVRKLGDIGWLAAAKATELSDRAEALIKNIPANQAQVGSIAPDKTIEGFYDLFDEAGRPLCKTDTAGKINCQLLTANAIPKFVRQWLIVKDHPKANDISIYVTVSHKDSNKIVRQVREVKTEAVLTK